MRFRSMPIQRKLVLIILLTSAVAMLLMRVIIFAYEFVTFRQATERNLSTLSRIVANNSTAALAFENPDDAAEILGAFAAEPQVVAAALYDRRGKLFAKYASGGADAQFPASPGPDGYRMNGALLAGFEPVTQKATRLGTLFIEFDTRTVLYAWIWASVEVAAGVMLIMLLVAYLISRRLQRQVSQPILALAETARMVSEHRDYSVRAIKLSDDELGSLTDAFNQMLGRIHDQNRTLRQNELQLKTIIENLDEGLAVSNLEGQLLHFNRVALELHGFSGLEEGRRHLSEFSSIFELLTMDGTVLPLERWPLARILKGERLHDCELRIRRLRSDWQRIFNYGGVLVRDTADKPMMAIVTINDITERKKMEAANAQVAAIVESSDDAIISKTPEGIITSWNRGAARMFGYTAQEAVGRPILILFPPERATEENSILVRIQRGETINHFETVRLTKEGKQIDVSVTVSPIRNKEGKIIGISKIARDITERKLERIRLQFRALFEALPGLYVVLTPDLKIVAASDAYLKATMTKREEIIGRKLFEVFPDNPDHPESNAVANTAASLDRVRKNAVSDSTAIQRYDVRRPDGVFEERYWSPINSPILGTNGKVEYIIHRVEDVTEFVLRKQQPPSNSAHLHERMEKMEAEVFRSALAVQLANQQLQAVNGELEAFSYSVSHDLRAPLRHINGFAELLSKHAVATMDEKGRHYVETISKSAKRMGQLIDELLLFSRMGRAEFHLAEIDQDSLVSELIRETEARKHAAIDWQVAPLPRVEADPVLFRQVWFNLVDNAVKYSAKSPKPRIEIGHQTDPKTGERQFFVRDNGAGFDMQYAGKLFGVFQRLHSATEFEGTGIGLANVRRIVQRHGGRTWAEGRVGQGATFYFSLPPAAHASSSDPGVSEPIPFHHE